MRHKIKGERWKKVIIDGIETRYEISNKGRLYNGKKMMKYTSIKNEYVGCSLRLNGKYHTTRVHRLVAIAFKKNPKNLPEINHKDGIKYNNESNNLEWCTHRHNIIHSFDIGLCVRPKGKDSHLFDKGRKIKDLNTGIVYPSVATAARALNVPRTTISAEIHGYRERKLNIIKL